MSFQNPDEIEDALKSPGLSVRDLYAVWEQRQPVPEPVNPQSAGASRGDARQIPWLQSNVSAARLFTGRALEKEEFLLVCDAAREALRLWPGANEDERTELVRVRMNYAAALTRLGFTRAARSELEPCVSEDFRPKLGRRLKADILLQLGNILREESHHAAARAVRLQTAREALAFYQRALEVEPERLEALVLTAAASLILGEPGSSLRGQAEDKAREVLTLTRKLDDTDGPRLQPTQARAIAHAVLGEIEAAARSYGELQTMDGATTAYLAEARHRTQFLAEALGQSRDLFKSAFPALQLIVFAGHLPDRPGERMRFPPESIDAVREQLRKKLDDLDVRVGMVSAAAGADLLFIEALLKRKGTVHLVLPWSQEEFCRTSVRPFEPSGSPAIWEPLFHHAIQEAATVREIGQVYEPASEIAWQYTMEVNAGLALHAARASRLDVQPMVLWDGLPENKVGGTASFAEFWRRQLKREPIILEMPARPAQDGTGSRLVERSRRCERPTLQHQVKSMLFADIVGYSKLTEHVVPEFVGIFLDRVSQLAATSAHAPRSLNTWGDAIYAVFDFAHEAGCFALELTQMIQEGEAEWLQKGLYWESDADENAEPVKHPLNIRVGLHTGPVFMHYDPVVRRLGFTGAHVNRAARIEPVAKPGEVFASEEFAALSEFDAETRRLDGRGEAGEQSGAFVCEYAGSMQLAKGYPGRHRIYRVVRHRVFAIEELAQAAHEFYCAEALVRGETSEKNSALCPWKNLPEYLREANRAQVADIPNKLHWLGYELAPGYGISPSEITITATQIEQLAIREHERWMDERTREGWTYASKRDNARRHHPLLVAWDELSGPEKEKDRDTVRNLPRLIEKAGFRVRKLGEVK